MRGKVQNIKETQELKRQLINATSTKNQMKPAVPSLRKGNDKATSNNNLNSTAGCSPSDDKIRKHNKPKPPEVLQNADTVKKTSTSTQQHCKDLSCGNKHLKEITSQVHMFADKIIDTVEPYR